MFEIDADEAWDIDDELDFEICEFLLDAAGKRVGERWMKRLTESAPHSSSDCRCDDRDLWRPACRSWASIGTTGICW